MSRDEFDPYGPSGALPETGSHGLFIVNEGNFQYGNATLSYYSPEDKTVANEVFYKANGMRLGDVAQSMTMWNGMGWIVVNNSHVIFAIDRTTLRERGRITDLTSPRQIHFVNDRKAYVTQLWDNNIYIVNPSDFSVTGFITVEGMAQQSGSTERMVQIGKYVYVTCWSYQREMLKIDTESDRIVGRIDVGVQPGPLVKDFKGRLWTITDGGYKGSPAGWGDARLVCVDPDQMQIVRSFVFPQGSSPRQLATDAAESRLYYINDDLFVMDVESDRLPDVPLVESHDRLFYALTVDPYRGDVYVSDAIDYTQQGIIYRYSADGELIDKFYAGVTPGSFCWIP